MPDSGADRVIYHEKVKYTLLVPVLVLGLIVLYVAITVGSVVADNVLLAVIFGVAAVVIGAVFLGFRRLDFVVTAGFVEFGFPLSKRRIPRELIVSCEPYELTFGNFLGYGIRLGMDGSVAYNTRNGPGVKIVAEGYKRPYVVTVENPEKVCGIVSGDR